MGLAFLHSVACKRFVACPMSFCNIPLNKFFRLANIRMQIHLSSNFFQLSGEECGTLTGWPVWHDSVNNLRF